MAILPSFQTPGNVADHHPVDWSRAVHSLFSHFAARFPQFYDPTATDTPPEASAAAVIWPAFPGSLRGSPLERLEIADGHRGAQDEYCEWGVDRNDGGKITRVTFTTELPEYFEHLFLSDPSDPQALLALYHEFVGTQVAIEDIAPDGEYLRKNQWNQSTDRAPVHLMQGSNNLEAAVQLAAEATILRERADGTRVTHNQELVECGGLGEPLRNSDPQIAATVNNAVAAGAAVTLRDPVGLYIDGLITGGMVTPDAEDPATFWRIERGEPGNVVRASYEVPPSEERGYFVGDITIDGRRIEFGGQLARRVRIRLDAIVKPGDHIPDSQPCESA